MWFVKVPKARIGVLIGTDGETRDLLERRTGCRIIIDSESGDVNVETEGADPIMALKARDLIKAIARGFSPERALVLLNEGYYFELLDVRDFTGKNPKAVHRMKARLIGRNGRTRQLLEELTEAEVSIYGNTIGIIGDYETAKVAHDAVEMLLNGAKHSTVYRYLEDKRREHKAEMFEAIVYSE